ncbi:MAG: class I SAM-dependent methyltransferase [Patescibacteria group bacterium]
MSQDINLRTTFNKVAKLYDLARPHYPEELFYSVVKIAKLRGTAKLLEIGPGTGQATEPFAKRGYKITAVEISPALAKIAKKNLAKFKNVKIITKALENTKLPANSFDLVYAATSYHWLKPKAKFAKPHRLLKKGGHLAIIGTNHVSDEKGDKFFFASEAIYKKYRAGGEYDDNFRLSPAIKLKAHEVDKKFFTPVFFRAFPLVIQYSSKKYSQLLNTFSPTLAMEPKKRAGFLKEIEKLIDKKFGGNLEHHFAMTLTIAKKKLFLASSQSLLGTETKK